MSEAASPYSDDIDGVPLGTYLIRRINARYCDWGDLDDAGNPRITSQAVQFYREEEARRLGCPGPAMSFVLESPSRDIEELVQRHVGYGFARIATDEVRLEGVLGVQPWPTDEDLAHVVVFRIDGGPRLASAQARRIARSLSQGWIIPPRKPDDAQ